MPRYTVDFTERALPAMATSAADVAELGEQVAAHLYKSRWLVSGYGYDALIGTDRGAIRQAGRVITFAITTQEK